MSDTTTGYDITSEAVAAKERLAATLPAELDDGTGYAYLRERAAIAHRECETRLQTGHGSWRLILREHYRQTVAQDDLADLRAGLLEVAATALLWIDDIDRRAGA